MSICEHCRHYNKKTLNGIKVGEFCREGLRLHVIECYAFNQSWKSKLGLVKELVE